MAPGKRLPLLPGRHRRPGRRGSRRDLEKPEELQLGDPKSQISGPYNQIWEAKSTGAADNPGKLVLLDADGFGDAKASETKEWMSDPKTLKAIIDYDIEIQAVIAVMPEGDGRADFLASYLDALHEYNLIQITGKTVTELVNKGVDRGAINYETVKNRWTSPSYPEYPSLSNLTYWGTYVEPLFETMGDGDADAAEADAKDWLDVVIRQQASEAIATDNVTAKSVLMHNGTGNRVKIEQTRRRVVGGMSANVSAELPAVYEYIEDHEDALGHLLGEDAANLYLGSVSATVDASDDELGDETGDFLHDYINWFNTSTTTSWNIDAMEQKWYAIRDADGKLYAAPVEIGPGKTIVPMMRERDEQPAAEGGATGSDVDPDDPEKVEEPNPELLILGFSDGDLSQIYLTDDEGNRRIIRPRDLKTELKLRPAIYISGWSGYTLLPASSSEFTVAPDNVDDIKLVYTDISNISDIGDVDGDGEAFRFTYTVTDIYGSTID